jgi:hypothetical protein
MTKMFYDWEDATDKYSTGYPDLGRYPQFRLYSKKAVREEWREYMKEWMKEAKVRPQPKIRVWKISYDEVTL